jgi:hypothetical protein
MPVQLDVVVGPDPCSDCRLAPQCAARLMACSAFVQFIHSAPWKHAPRAPRRELYLLVFEPPGRGGRPGNQNARKATPDARTRGAARIRS